MIKLGERNYVERDVSWMYFNHRILDEAQRTDIPVMERLNFLGIYSNNLDEFFRVRVAALNRVVELAEKKDVRRRCEQTLSMVNALNTRYAGEFAEVMDDVTQQLAQLGIHILDEKNLSESQQEFVRDYFQKNLLGSLSPLWLSSQKSLSAPSDDVICLAVRLQRWRQDQKKAAKSYAVIELPVKQLGRFVMLPDEVIDGKVRHNVMYLDDIVRCVLPHMFPGTDYNHFEAWSFKVTKDAEMELETDIRGGMLQKISKGIKSRRNGLPVRIIYDKMMPRDVLRQITSRMCMASLDTMMSAGRYQNHKDLMKFPKVANPGDGPKLEYERWAPVTPKGAMTTALIAAVRQRDRFLHVPYHSFSTYINLLREAAVNPEVKAIRTTLYRLAKDSKVISALIAAARNGKKVTVVIELLARFDEESNIDWSKKMADAGINVITGVEGLKIHSKITHIEAKYGNIAVISTGNFHEGNASAYTDFLMFTASRPVVNEVEKVFRFIEKPYLPVKFKELLVSPNGMRSSIENLIKQEIRNRRNGLPARILCKLNHITDEGIVRRLYEAAAAGVKVDLVVRGNCSLVPELKELCGNMHITPIIDRYLEHSRILIFANGCDMDKALEPGQAQDYKVYIGSADWMPRNLDHRIEVYAPVHDAALKREARLIVEWGLKNKRNTFRSQEELYRHYVSENTQNNIIL